MFVTSPQYVTNTLSANRFHPDHLQEFLSQKKKKSEGWKCDVSYLPCILIYFMHYKQKERAQ